MSYGVMAYAVDLERVRGWIGSGDAELLGRMKTDLARELRWLDQNFDSDGLKSGDALRQMVMGEPYDRSRPELYAYTYKLMCELFGGCLPNSHWSGMRWGWFDTVQAFVKRAGVAFDVLDVVSGAPGVPLPHVDDFPVMGYFTRDEVARHAATLAAADWPTDAPAELAAVRELQSWFDTCKEGNGDLVCFYH